MDKEKLAVAYHRRYYGLAIGPGAFCNHYRNIFHCSLVYFALRFIVYFLQLK